MQTSKPDLDSFVRKADDARKEPKPIKGQGQADKTFLLHLPYELWYRLKMEALQEGKTLHEYILQTLRTRRG
jgi:hypothetical protein